MHPHVSDQKSSWLSSPYMASGLTTAACVATGAVAALGLAALFPQQHKGFVGQQTALQTFPENLYRCPQTVFPIAKHSLFAGLDFTPHMPTASSSNLVQQALAFFKRVTGANNAHSPAFVSQNFNAKKTALATVVPQAPHTVKAAATFTTADLRQDAASSRLGRQAISFYSLSKGKANFRLNMEAHTNPSSPTIFQHVSAAFQHVPAAFQRVSAAKNRAIAHYVSFMARHSAKIQGAIIFTGAVCYFSSPIYRKWKIQSRLYKEARSQLEKLGVGPNFSPENLDQLPQSLIHPQNPGEKFKEVARAVEASAEYFFNKVGLQSPLKEVLPGFKYWGRRTYSEQSKATHFELALQHFLDARAKRKPHLKKLRVSAFARAFENVGVTASGNKLQVIDRFKYSGYGNFYKDAYELLALMHSI